MSTLRTWVGLPPEHRFRLQVSHQEGPEAFSAYCFYDDFTGTGDNQLTHRELTAARPAERLLRTSAVEARLEIQYLSSERTTVEVTAQAVDARGRPYPNLAGTTEYRQRFSTAGGSTCTRLMFVLTCRA